MIDATDLPSWAKPNLWLDSENFLTFVYWKDETEPYQALWYHRPRTPKEHTLDGLKGWCMGGFGWRNPDAADFQGRVTWTLESWEPLTVSPSLLCLDCQAHGFIRDGKWIPV